jgi:hypothetical protein
VRSYDTAPRRWTVAARQAFAEDRIEDALPGECVCLWWAIFHGQVTDEADPVPLSDLCDAHAHLLDQEPL